MDIGNAESEGRPGKINRAKVVHLTREPGLAVNGGNGAVDNEIRPVLDEITPDVLGIPQTQTLAVRDQQVDVTGGPGLEVMHQGAAD